MRRTALQLGLTLAVALSVGWISASAATPGAVAASSATKSDQLAKTVTTAKAKDPLTTVTTVKVKDQDVREVFAMVFRAMEADFLLTEDVSGIISMHKENVTVKNILDTICAAKGLHWWKKDGTYVVSGQPAPAETSKSDVVVAKPSATLAAEQPVQAESPKKMRQYSAKFWNPRDLAAMFNSDVEPTPQGRKFLMNLTGLSKDQAMNMGKTSGSAPESSYRDAFVGKSRLGESSQFPGLGLGSTGIGTLAQPTIGTAGDQDYTEEELELLESGVNLSAPFAALLPRGMTAPVAYEPLNYLIFEATDEAYDRFLELVRIFDQKPKQVIIDVQFVTMTTSDFFNFGMDWFLNIGRTSLSVTGLAQTGNITLQLAKGEEFAATLSSLLTTSKARLIQAPRVASTNNFQAIIDFTESFPYVDFGGAVAVPNGGIVGGGAQIRWINIPTYLALTPRVNADDSVTMDLNPVITSVRTAAVPTPDGGTQNVPQTSQNSISTHLTIGNGETMVIGGFVSRNETTDRAKIPLLSDLPLIGSLFQSVEKSSTDSELLIFVTPHVIKDEYTAGTNVSF